MGLRDIFCQDRAIEQLQRAFAAGRMPHAYIFAGPDGVGKFTTARELAKMLLCHDRIQTGGEGPFADSCARCESCLLFEQGAAHPDFVALSKEMIRFVRDPEERKRSPTEFPKSVVDEFLIEKVAARPAMGERKVYVIRQAERLNRSSQNALLKVLEEPPPHCLIVLLCTRVDSLLPTTLSRCQVVRFGPVDEARIVRRLTDEGTPQTEALFWARLSMGSLGGALVWAQTRPRDTSAYAIKTALVERFVGCGLADVPELAEWMIASGKLIAAAWSQQMPQTSGAEIGRLAQKGMVHIVVCALADAMHVSLGRSNGLVNVDQKACVERLAGRWSAEDLARLVAKGHESLGWIDDYVNEKLLFEELLFSYADPAILKGCRVDE